MARTARAAHSVGFTGTDMAYAELYEVTCKTEEDCVEPCADRGGEPEMCEASQCLPNPDMSSDCLPPPVWSNLGAIRFTSDLTVDAVQLVVVDTAYSDALIAEELALALEVPESASIEGITVEVRKASGGYVVDDSVRIVKGGMIGSAERASTTEWGQDFAWVTYGGPDDLWGETWTPADVNADDFGVALSALYTRTAGNTRAWAYVDQVRVTVHYSLACD